MMDSKYYASKAIAKVRTKTDHSLSRSREVSPVNDRRIVPKIVDAKKYIEMKRESGGFFNPNSQSHVRNNNRMASSQNKSSHVSYANLSKSKTNIDVSYVSKRGHPYPKRMNNNLSYNDKTSQGIYINSSKCDISREKDRSRAEKNCCRSTAQKNIIVDTHSHSRSKSSKIEACQKANLRVDHHYDNTPKESASASASASAKQSYKEDQHQQSKEELRKKGKETSSYTYSINSKALEVIDTELDSIYRKYKQLIKANNESHDDSSYSLMQYNNNHNKSKETAQTKENVKKNILKINTHQPQTSKLLELSSPPQSNLNIDAIITKKPVSNNKIFFESKDATESRLNNNTNNTTNNNYAFLNQCPSEQNIFNSRSNKETRDSYKCKLTNTHSSGPATFEEAKIVSNKNIETIEEMHLIFVNIIQSSKKIIRLQEQGKESENIYGTVSKCEEKDL